MKKHRKLSTAIVVVAVLIAALTTVGVMAFTGEQATRQAGTAQTDAAAATPGLKPRPGAPSSPRVSSACAARGAQHGRQWHRVRGLGKEGDQVAAGQAILRLKDERQRAALAGADAALANAQAQLDTLKAGARTQQITAAHARLDAAKARLARLQESARPEDLAAARPASPRRKPY